MTVSNIEDYIRFNNITTIFLDWDGVLTHSCQAIVDICNQKFGKNVNGSDVLNWNFRDAFPLLEEEEMEKLFETEEFFDNLKFMDGVVEFMKRHESEIIIVTKSTPQNFLGKIDMLNSVGLHIPIIPIPYKITKGIIDMYGNLGKSLFIDDNVDNLVESNADFKLCFVEYNDGKKREWQELNKYFCYDIIDSWK